MVGSVVGVFLGVVVVYGFIIDGVNDVVCK